MDRTERTYSTHAFNHKLQWGPITLWADRQQVRVDGILLDLTRVEFKLMHLLIQNPGRTFNRAYLEEVIWETQTGSDQTVDKAIARIQTRLGTHGNLIESVWGAGYRLRGKP